MIAGLELLVAALVISAGPGGAQTRDDAANADRAGRGALFLMWSYGAELGGAPFMAGGKVGVGLVRGGRHALVHRWMLWLEGDLTARTPVTGASDDNRRVAYLWLFPYLEYEMQVAPRDWRLFWYAQAGPALLDYAVIASGDEQILVPGVVAGLGLQWAVFRVGVRYYGQWSSGSTHFGGRAEAYSIRPVVMFTCGAELPIVPMD